MRYLATLVVMLVASSILAKAQIPLATAVQIAKAEDSRTYDATFEALFSSPIADVRRRAALAAGRIGDVAAVGALERLVAKDASDDVRATAVFALGEIESLDAAAAVVAVLDDTKASAEVRGRAIEAAGKIAAANLPQDDAKQLGLAILSALRFEDTKRSAAYGNVVRLGLTALLRVRPPGADDVAARFLRYSDTSIVADALNTLARLRSRDANAEVRDLLKKASDPVVRANAARVLGVAEAKELVPELLVAAVGDKDSRVRVSAIRSLGSLNDRSAAGPLIARGNLLLTEIGKTPYHTAPSQKSELIEIAAVIGRLMQGTGDVAAIKFLKDFGVLDRFLTPEIFIALARVSPYEMLKTYDHTHCAFKRSQPSCWKYLSGLDQGRAELARLPAADTLRAEALEDVRSAIKAEKELEFAADSKNTRMAIPDRLRSFAAFKTDDAAQIIRPFLTYGDVQVRAAAAGIISDLPSSKENIDALKSAFDRAVVSDKRDNDAQLAILDALFQLNKKEAVGRLLVAVDSPDYLVRKRAIRMLEDKDLQKAFPEITTTLDKVRAEHKDRVLPYSASMGTKLGQVLNSDADYRRALSRRNGSVKAVVKTDKGTFTIDFYPEDAPLTVDNFIKLARKEYFNGLEVHRVVPNFVMQDGDPRGDGSGGPGWSIRCEINMHEYGRGAIGMALSGKDTGGSQWFVTHSPQPHLDGGYTVFGQVSEADMKVVDAIVRGDRIISVRIIGK